MEASECPGPSRFLTASAATGDSRRCATSATIEWPSWPHASTCPVRAKLNTPDRINAFIANALSSGGASVAAARDKHNMRKGGREKQVGDLVAASKAASNAPRMAAAPL